MREIVKSMVLNIISGSLVLYFDEIVVVDGVEESVVK